MATRQHIAALVYVECSCGWNNRRRENAVTTKPCPMCGGQVQAKRQPACVVCGTLLRPCSNGAICGECRKKRSALSIEHLCAASEHGDKRKAELRLEAWKKQRERIAPLMAQPERTEQ